MVVLFLPQLTLYLLVSIQKQIQWSCICRHRKRYDYLSPQNINLSLWPNHWLPNYVQISTEYLSDLVCPSPDQSTPALPWSISVVKISISVAVLHISTGKQTPGHTPSKLLVMNGIYYELIDVNICGKYNFLWDGYIISAVVFESLWKEALPWFSGRFLLQFSGVIEQSQSSCSRLSPGNT